ncbi:hypothetical protein SLS55_006521 [Diplodia seriata]|uniref:Sulfite oxidase, mitochondrial n=1 Tax=Diplodia seriata TaxID=420778 RepID=A0A1S8BE30_9PEZI|nr:Sulfite oxidase, mitochondrial [Diplodia seriata]
MRSAIPTIDGQTHRVTVDGVVRTPLSLSLQDLQSLPQHTVICALQCAGNRRHTMRTEMKEVSGLDWFDGAVMNCKWRGPRLRDVLLKAGASMGVAEALDAHVAFACHQNPCQEDEWYGASIPLSRAMSLDADVLLALEMNDAPLTPNHGFPVRIVTPGIAGARSVKWLDRITVQNHESPNHYQQRDYKILPPDVDTAEKAEGVWDRIPALQDMPVNSVIGVPANGSKLERDAKGKIEVKGYALPGGSSGPVVKVEVSADGGRTWQFAELLGDDHFKKEGVSLKWAWRLWRTNVKVEEGKGRILLSRATDTDGNTQDERCQWNLRGCAYNGYGEVKDLEIV